MTKRNQSKLASSSQSIYVLPVRAILIICTTIWEFRLNKNYDINTFKLLVNALFISFGAGWPFYTKERKSFRTVIIIYIRDESSNHHLLQRSNNLFSMVIKNYFVTKLSLRIPPTFLSFVYFIIVVWWRKKWNLNWTISINIHLKWTNASERTKSTQSQTIICSTFCSVQRHTYTQSLIIHNNLPIWNSYNTIFIQWLKNKNILFKVVKTEKTHCQFNNGDHNGIWQQRR